ncbi:phosphoglycolate phosphatase [Albidovulum inexpectatum]|uniref:phosphoglycolate phosphatase n=1 Tax=Albidovulum inexpectatum TaxID=196587 RepID=A0A2S5JKB0_9RHOB|nr:HAD-IA family hydrolase [Albidovulum inexpectatum]PPB81831.1 phosphoglycolate phosphatase [Albidovulum inexpectatum]
MGTIVFDLDGTLADTSADLIAAANACFRRRGHGDVLDPVADALTAFHGGRAMLRLGYRRLGIGGEAEVEADYPVLLQAYEEGIANHTQLYPGAAEAVEALLRAGYRTAICTNKPERLARILLRHLGVLDLFGALVGADTLPVRKPDPAPYRRAVDVVGGDVARSFLIGDTETDLLTARAARVPVVMVSFGPEGPGIARLNPDAMLDHFDGLGALAKRILA